MRTHQRTAILIPSILIVVIAVVAGIVSARADAIDPITAPSAIGAIGAFSAAGIPPSDRSRKAAEQLAGGLSSIDPADLSRLRVLAEGLGPDAAELVVFPSQSGGNICYALAPSSETNPGAGYCYAPLHPNVPKPLEGKDFHVSALEYVDPHGLANTELFGIAFDDVISLEVSVDGTFRPVRLTGNGFYQYLPSTRIADVGSVVATLRNGERQSFDVQHGG